MYVVIGLNDSTGIVGEATGFESSCRLLLRSPVSEDFTMSLALCRSKLRDLTDAALIGKKRKNAAGFLRHRFVMHKQNRHLPMSSRQKTDFLRFMDESLVKLMNWESSQNNGRK